MDEKDAISAYLQEKRNAGLSSPAGMHWHKFYLMLEPHGIDGDQPLAPLILAASIASDDEKHIRLEEQLQWAADHQCLKEAMNFLEQIPNQNWNSSPPDKWNQQFEW